MPHKNGFLVGTGPQEKEEKTAAQINDERNPEAMRQSDVLFNRFNETDERPAIEQTFQPNEVTIQQHIGKSFQISQEAEQEIHARQYAERAKRKRAQEIAAKTEKQIAEAQAKATEERLKAPQSLDPEQIKQEHIDEERLKNLQKLYPDPISSQSDTEEALWQKRKDKGAQIAGRAKLEDVYDSELHEGIMQSFRLQALGVIPLLLIIFDALRFSLIAHIAIHVICVILFTFSYTMLNKCSIRYRNKEIPSDQLNQFKLATILPFMALRIGIMEVFGPTLFGSVIGIILSIFIGSGLHYNYLSKFNVQSDEKIQLINLATYAFLTITPSLLVFISSRSRGAMEMTMGLVWILRVVVFTLGDHFIAKLEMRNATTG